jgi:hypothetical protein
MPNDRDRMISPALASVLSTFASFVLSDDADREDIIEASDPTTLTALVAAVDPLFGEINAVLDRFDEGPRPGSADDQQLESDLHSLAQAAMEARMQLDD